METPSPTTSSTPLDSFVNLVAEMRKAQNIYFRTRGGLDDCKKIERAVDRYVTEYREKNQPQAKLF